MIVSSEASEHEFMRHRQGLPPELGAQFSLRAARQAGVGRARCNARDLHRPYPGVRSIASPISFVETAACFFERIRPGQRFGGRTAARLWRLPVPWSWSAAEALVVIVPSSAAPPAVTGVEGRRLRHERAKTWRIDGLPVLDPVATLFTLARDLTIAQTVVLIDALVTDADNYPRLRRPAGRRALATMDEITARLAEWGRFPGCATIRTALRRAREHVESPKETETRVMLVDAGLPEPAVQFEEWEGGRCLARLDLAYPELKIAIEYEGDGHRTDRTQWRRDIARQRELEARGWIVIRLTQDDLSDPEGVLRSIRAALAARSR